MIKKPDKQEFSVFSFMSPLSTEIWMVRSVYILDSTNDMIYTY